MTGAGDNIGGLAGENEGVITDSRSTGAVSGANTVGGLAGSNLGDILGSYASGSVTNNGNSIHRDFGGLRRK